MRSAVRTKAKKAPTSLRQQQQQPSQQDQPEQPSETLPLLQHGLALASSSSSLDSAFLATLQRVHSEFAANQEAPLNPSLETLSEERIDALIHRLTNQIDSDKSSSEDEDEEDEQHTSFSHSTSTLFESDTTPMATDPLKQKKSIPLKPIDLLLGLPAEEPLSFFHASTQVYSALFSTGTTTRDDLLVTDAAPSPVATTPRYHPASKSTSAVKKKDPSSKPFDSKTSTTSTVDPRITAAFRAVNPSNHRSSEAEALEVEVERLLTSGRGDAGFGFDDGFEFGGVNTRDEAGEPQDEYDAAESGLFHHHLVSATTLPQPVPRAKHTLASLFSCSSTTSVKMYKPGDSDEEEEEWILNRRGAKGGVVPGVSSNTLVNECVGGFVGDVDVGEFGSGAVSDADSISAVVGEDSSAKRRKKKKKNKKKKKAGAVAGEVGSVVEVEVEMLQQQHERFVSLFEGYPSFLHLVVPSATTTGAVMAEAVASDSGGVESPVAAAVDSSGAKKKKNKKKKKKGGAGGGSAGDGEVQTLDSAVVMDPLVNNHLRGAAQLDIVVQVASAEPDAVDEASGQRETRRVAGKKGKGKKKKRGSGKFVRNAGVARVGGSVRSVESYEDESESEQERDVVESVSDIPPACPAASPLDSRALITLEYSTTTATTEWTPALLSPTITTTSLASATTSHVKAQLSTLFAAPPSRTVAPAVPEPAIVPRAQPSRAANASPAPPRPAPRVSAVTATSAARPTVIPEWQRLVVSGSVPVSAYPDLMDEVKKLGYEIHNAYRKPDGPPPHTAPFPRHRDSTDTPPPSTSLHMHLRKTRTAVPLAPQLGLQRLETVVSKHNMASTTQQRIFSYSMGGRQHPSPSMDVTRCLHRIATRGTAFVAADEARVSCVLVRPEGGVRLLRALVEAWEVVGVRGVGEEGVGREVAEWCVGGRFGERWEERVGVVMMGGWWCFVCWGSGIGEGVEGVCDAVRQSLSNDGVEECTVFSSRTPQQTHALLSLLFRDSDLTLPTPRCPIDALTAPEDPETVPRHVGGIAASLVSPVKGGLCVVVVKGGVTELAGAMEVVGGVEGCAVVGVRDVKEGEWEGGSGVAVVVWGVRVLRRVKAVVEQLPVNLASTIHVPASHMESQHLLSTFYPHHTLPLLITQTPTLGEFSRRVSVHTPIRLPSPPRRLIPTHNSTTRVSLCVMVMREGAFEFSWEAWGKGVGRLVAEGRRCVGVRFGVLEESGARRVVEGGGEGEVLSVHNILNGPCLFLAFEHSSHSSVEVVSPFEGGPEAGYCVELGHVESVELIPVLFPEVGGAKGWRVVRGASRFGGGR
ncbi:hypothetical protein HDU98_000602 [Podochytrium sp. JEL0797]|nr:hypothetical protein HDU98_000602 [Podochytrium sp. JEL0797]